MLNARYMARIEQLPARDDFIKDKPDAIFST
jgi:hypothetical protein